ncbi:unnamed protein product, partial [Mesorhabditis spiculigera]
MFALPKCIERVWADKFESRYQIRKYPSPEKRDNFILPRFWWDQLFGPSYCSPPGSDSTIRGYTVHNGADKVTLILSLFVDFLLGLCTSISLFDRLLDRTELMLTGVVKSLLEHIPSLFEFARGKIKGTREAQQLAEQAKTQKQELETRIAQVRGQDFVDLRPLVAYDPEPV